jgi:PAS domain S-box-containing protein
MKIRTHYLLNMLLFGIISVVVAVSLIITHQRMERIGQQREIAEIIERSARELSYLSNDYLLHREDQQRSRWETKLAEVDMALAELEPATPQELTLVDNIKASQARLTTVFNSVADAFGNEAQIRDVSDEMALIRVAWSRMEVQTQGTVFYTLLLVQEYRGQANQLRRMSSLLGFVVAGVLGASLFSNYFLTFRRTLKSIIRLQEETKIIGSGNLDYTIPVERNDEIGDLSRAFNAMTQNLKAVTASKAELEKEIAERKMAEESLRKSERLLAQRLDTLRALFEISQALMGRHQDGPVLRLICEEAVRRFGLHMAWIGLLREDGQVMPAAAYGRDHGYAAAIFGLDPAVPAPLDVRSPVIEAIRAEEAHVVSDPQQMIELPERLHQEVLQRGYGARAAFPIRVEGQSLGALVTYVTEPERFGEEQLNAMQSLANLAALSLQRAQLVERIASHARTLEETVAQRTDELVRSEAHLRAIVDGAAIGIAVVDGKGHILSANPTLEEMLGRTAADLVGQGVTDYVSEEDLATQRPQFQGLLTGDEQVVRLAIQYQRGDGKLGWANVVVSRLPNTSRDRDRGRFVLMAEDTTEQRRTMAALLQSEKLAATGRLVAGLAHEINNPLQAVIGCLGLAQEVLAEGESAENYLSIATQELQRAAKLVRDLRAVYLPGDEHREPTDLNALVRRVLDITQRQRDEAQVEAEARLVDDLPMVQAVPDRIQQVMLNLVLNAVDAMPEGGRLEVVSSASDDPESGQRGVRIEFRDSGVGMSDEMLMQLFEPFVTTKEQGSGLGLFICRTILEQHGGWIRMESVEGEGTTAIFWLPC